MPRLYILAIFLSSAIGCRESEIRHMERSAFSMTATDVFDIKGQGPLVMGRVNAGQIAVGDQAIALLGRDTTHVTIRAIEKFRQTRLKEVSAGPDDVGLELEGVSAARLREALASGPLTLVAKP